VVRQRIVEVERAVHEARPHRQLERDGRRARRVGDGARLAVDDGVAAALVVATFFIRGLALVIVGLV
jgi:hypothetical protein